MKHAPIRSSVVFLACSVLLNVAVYSALRVVFYMIFRIPADPVPTAILLKSLHFDCLQSRLDVTAVRLLYNLSTSLQMIWDTYPVVWSLLGLGMFIAALWFFIYRAVSWLSSFDRPTKACRLRTAATFALA